MKYLPPTRDAKTLQTYKPGLEAGAQIRGGVGGGGVRHPPNIFRVGPKLNEKSVHDKAWIV